MSGGSQIGGLAHNVTVGGVPRTTAARREWHRRNARSAAARILARQAAAGQQGYDNDLPELVCGDSSESESVEDEGDDGYGCCYTRGGIGLYGMFPKCDAAEVDATTAGANGGSTADPVNVDCVNTDVTGKATVMYSNVRGLRQANSEFRNAVHTHRPTFVVLTETHLKDDAVEAEMLPDGYKVAARYDRSVHGGGVIIFSQDHLLVDRIKCDKWCISEKAEIVGIEFAGCAVFGCYTQSSETAAILFSALREIRTSKKFKNKKLIFCMDANSHHRDWLGSKYTDAAGKAARTFTLDYGMKQFIDFPTHSKGNILDLIISDLWLEAVPLPHLGSSDHINILCTVKVDTAMPEPPPGRRVYHWKTAPWDRIRGGIRADLRSWKASDFKTVDEALDDLYTCSRQVCEEFSTFSTFLNVTRKAEKSF